MFRYIYSPKGLPVEYLTPKGFAMLIVSEGYPQALVNQLIDVCARNCRLQAANAAYEGHDINTFKCEVTPELTVEYKPEQVTPETHEQAALPLEDAPRANQRYSRYGRSGGSLDRKSMASGERADD